MQTRALSERGAVEVEPGVHLARLAAGDRMSVQHVHVESGATVPEHDHDHEQVGYVYDGALTFVVDGEELVVTTGESYAIPSGEPHAARNDGDDSAAAIDVFSPPRPDPDWA